MFAVFVLSADIYWFIDIISIWKDCSKDGKVGWWLENLAILWSNNPNLGFSPSLSTVYFHFLLKLGDFILIQISCQFIAQWFHHKVDQAGNRSSPRRAIFKILLIWFHLKFSAGDNHFLHSTTRGKVGWLFPCQSWELHFRGCCHLWHVSTFSLDVQSYNLKTAAHWVHIILQKSS